MKKLLPVLLLALATSCAPKVGDSCEPNEATCISPTEGLFCEAGRLRILDCHGPRGCSTPIQGRVFCDFTTARSGDSCLAVDEGQKQCHRANANELLVCHSGVWMEEACKGCVKEGSTIICQP